MKDLKALGLAAVAAMALTALIGAGSASATVLCKTALSEGCAGAWDYPTGTEIDLSLASTTTTSTTGGELLDACTESTSKGSTTNTGGASETVDWNLTVYSSNNCTGTTDTVSNGSLEVHWVSGSTNGTVVSKGTQATKIIPAAVSCIYGTGTSGTVLGTLEGGAEPTLHVKTPLSKLSGGFLCPGEVVWDGLYSVTSPRPLYVSAS